MLADVGCMPLSTTLLSQQLVMFGKAARTRDMFQAAFADRLLRPAADQYVRKRGRPRLEWTAEVRKAALQIAGSIDRLCELVQDSDAWKHAVHNFLS